MKSLLLTIGLLTFTLLSYSQNIYQIRADSVRIYNDCDTAELILENRTQNVPGFLYNKGRGRTEFRRAQFLDLGLGLISIGGMDTLDFGNALSGSFIKNQFSTAQIADYWIKGRGRIDSTFTLSKYKNNATEDSVLTTDANGNVKLKLMSGGGGGGVQTLQQVTDTGNTTSNILMVTGVGRTPESSPASLELGLSTSTEYITQGPVGTINVRSRSKDEWGTDNSASGFLNIDGKGVVVTNDVNMGGHRLIMTTNTSNSTYSFPAGSTLQSQNGEQGFWQPGDLHLNPNGGRVIFSAAAGATGQTDILFEASVGFYVANSRNIATDYIDRACYTYLIKDATTRTLLLYEPSINPYRIVTIKKIINNSNAITIKIDGAGSIENGPSITLTDPLSSVQLQNDGTNWWILSKMGN